jgi:hypothetical protein
MTIRTENQLCKAVVKWQKLLRLQDWRIAVRLIRLKSMDEVGGVDGSVAGIAPNYEHKTALMYVLHPDDIKEDVFTGNDVERFVVHELMHVHTRALLELPRQTADNRQQTDAEEQLNEILSELLVDLHRNQVKKRKKKS